MALLDELLGGVLRNALGNTAGSPGGSGKAALIQAVLAMLMQGGQGAGGQQQSGGILGNILGQLGGTAGGGGSGGLGGLLGGGLGNLGQILEQVGMGDQMKSWVSNGQNMPISPDQVNHAFGPDQIGRLAEATGMTREQAADELSQLLPDLVNGLTPAGRMPQDDEVSQEDLGQFVSQVLAGNRREA
jgi:uncharacterized protein YidB (DUF937 family)